MTEEIRSIKDGYFFGIWGFIAHVIVLWGVLDANFHSPVFTGLAHVSPIKNAPAKRLFLFVADGLRYRTFSQNPAPYLHGVMKKEGTWGISHTRMPTESRPGNVAITAGLYEDPSALFRGWKENPVHFDSVFNQSTETWAWGSPDVVPMFSKGIKQNVHSESYPHDWEDFDKSSNPPRRLDSWVFDKYFNWLENEAERVKNDQGIILFFHLLGCDTAGHASKPYSNEYIESMKYVDHKIKEVVESAEAFFDDHKTAYIFTSDHGMTDWGSHGSGSSDETETPIVAWGAGIKKSNKPVDIEQADITPLISTLIGISIPANNEGRLRSDYLDSTNVNFTAQAVLNNFKQLSIQIKANRMLASGDGNRRIHRSEHDLAKIIEGMENYLNEGQSWAAMFHANDGLRFSKEALYYYRTFQTNQLIIYLTLMWLGWIVFLLFTLTGAPRHKTNYISKFSHMTLANLFFSVAGIVLVMEHLVSGRGDWRVPGYGIITLFSLWLACQKIITHSLTFEPSENVSLKSSTVGVTLLIFLMSAGLMKKYFFSFAMIVTAVMQYKFSKKPQKTLIVTSLMLVGFPILATVKPGTDLYQLLPTLAAPLFLLYTKKIERNLKILEATRMATTFLIITGLIDGRSGVSWIILISSPFSIFLYPAENAKRFTGVLFGFLCPLVLLSASYEPGFYVILATHLMELLDSMESEKNRLGNEILGEPRIISTNQKSNKKFLSPEDLVTAAYFMLYILLSFFGTGNMASISSFDPMWTKNFITVFSPFTMSALILLKLAIPLILIGCASRVLASSSIFLAVLLLGDGLSLPLMYSVSSEGSWLDIGTAISRYTIAVTLPCLFMFLYYLSSPLMTLSFSKNMFNKKYHLV